jgi:SRSO17 transposase
MQHLLARAAWGDEAVRDDLRGYVVEHLGDPEAVLIIDETGDVKKGAATVGVQRQYTGTAGRVENAQVGVYLVYAGAGGHAFIDRALYLPRSWTENSQRLRAAGVPDDVAFGKELAGLDEHQVRRWTSWHRWTVLAMLAQAFLAVTAATERARAAPPAGLIPLTPNEIRRLFIGLLTRPVRDATTKPPHAPATTAAKTANSNDHDLRPEY